MVVNGGETSAGRYAMRLSGEVYNLLIGKTAAAIISQANNHAVAVSGIRHIPASANAGHSLHAARFSRPSSYSAADLAFAGCDAILLTEKDAVKCAAFADARYWCCAWMPSSTRSGRPYIAKDDHGRKLPISSFARCANLPSSTARPNRN
jgi:tetraacyldisaccharide-1-P 4'-kinase